MMAVATMLAWAFLVAVVPGAAALVPGSRRPLLTPPYQACVQARPPCRTAVPMCLAVAAEDEEEASEEELKDELFELLDDVPARGFEATEDDIADVLEIIAELEETEGGEACFDFSNSPLFSGTFRLLYTSSKTFHTNERRRTHEFHGRRPGNGADGSGALLVQLLPHMCRWHRARADGHEHRAGVSADCHGARLCTTACATAAAVCAFLALDRRGQSRCAHDLAHQRLPSAATGGGCRLLLAPQAAVGPC